MINVKPLRYFLMVAKMRNFGRAAAELHMSQPPLSRQIAALEAAVGVPLFVRQPRNVFMTSAGLRFYEDATKIVEAIDAAGRNARAAARGNLGSLRIGFTMCASYSVMPRLTKTFADRYPDVSLTLREIVSNDLAKSVTSNDVDVAIMFNDTLPDGLTSRLMASEPLCLAIPTSHSLANRPSRPVDVSVLAKEPLVQATADVAPALRDTIVSYCRSAGFEPKIKFEVQLQQTILSLVHEGFGIAFVPTSMQKLRVSGVIFRRLKHSPTVDQTLVWSPNNTNPCLHTFLSLADE